MCWKSESIVLARGGLEWANLGVWAAIFMGGTNVWEARPLSFQWNEWICWAVWEPLLAVPSTSSSCDARISKINAVSSPTL
jgi:hypothetical protein